MNRKLYKGILVVWAIGPLIGVIVGITSLFAKKRIPLSSVLLFFGGWILTGLGVTGGFHRLLTHSAFKSHPVVKFLLLVLGSAAIQGKPIDWAAQHRKHHKYADKPGDPHSPTEGFWHAHLGWFFTGDSPEREKYAEDLLNDPVVMAAERTTYLWVALGFIIPYLIGKRSGLLWGGLIRVAFLNHTTFAVNSICHMFGKREFETTDVSRNNWPIAWLSWGEGWHNNHHAFPFMPFHGIGRQFDLTSLMIKLLVRLGLAEIDPRFVPTPEMMARRKQRLLEAKKRREQQETT